MKLLSIREIGKDHKFKNTREDLSLRQTHWEGRKIQAVSHFKSYKLFLKSSDFDKLI